MTAAYWLIGRRIVEQEQRGRKRAGYGEELIQQLAKDLTDRFGRGFGKSNLFEMRAFYQANVNIFQTVSGKSDLARASKKLQAASGKTETPSRISSLAELADAFPLSWSHYVLLVRRNRSDEARGLLRN